MGAEPADIAVADAGPVLRLYKAFLSFLAFQIADSTMASLCGASGGD
jgi:hypothetical protein